MSAENPLFEVDHPLQAYCVSLEEEQARMTKDVQDLKVTVASQIEEINRLLSILAKSTLTAATTKLYQFHITGTGVKEEFRHVADAVWADLQTLQVLDGISTQLNKTEMCHCCIIQREAGLALSVLGHQFVQTLETRARVRSIFSVLNKDILGKSWQVGGLRIGGHECGREQMYKRFSGQVQRDIKRRNFLKGF